MGGVRYPGAVERAPLLVADSVRALQTPGRRGGSGREALSSATPLVDLEGRCGDARNQLQRKNLRQWQ